MLIVPRLATFTAYDYLAAAAVHLLREREKGYPAAVTAGTMTAAQAADGLELMRVIVAQWRWVIDPAQPPLPDYDYINRGGLFGAQNYLLDAEMRRVAARADAISARDPVNWSKREMADLCEALAWYQQDVCGDPRVVTYTHNRAAFAWYRRAA